MTLPPVPTRLDEFVDYWVDRRPGAEFLVGGDERLTWTDVRAETDRMAAALIAAGVERGDRVGYLGNASVRFFVHFLATTSIGAIWVGLNPKYSATELAHVISDAGLRLAFTAATRDSFEAPQVIDLAGEGADAFLDRSREIDNDALRLRRADVRPDDPAFIVYTSGSTGRPKGAVLTHYGVARCGVIGASVRGLIGVRGLCNLPINHVGAVSDICIRIMVGGGSILMQERFDPELMMRTIRDEKIQVWGGVPTIFQLCRAHPSYDEIDLTCVEHIAWGGAPMPADLARELERKTGATRLSTGYGSTETIGGVTSTRPGDSIEVVTETAGSPVPEVELRVVDLLGQEAAPGEPGELWVRTDFGMAGYWNQPEATAKVVDADGWYHTGDEVRFREDGNMVFVGRLSDMFKSGGYNVYPREIELCLEDHPAVALAAVVGVPDTVFDEVGHAHLMLRGDTTVEALLEHCRAHLANYKVPKKVFLHESLPMLAVGKVDKVALRKKAY